jgi:MFS family permease
MARARRWILCTLFLAIVVTTFFSVVGAGSEAKLSVNSIRPIKGYVYVGTLPAFDPLFIDDGSDSNEHPSRSHGMLYESGARLGPSHSLHAQIKTIGLGRYSHWKGVLYFSTSDNSDPFQNGRSYRFQYRLYLRAWVPLILMALTAFVTYQTRAWRTTGKHPTLGRFICALSRSESAIVLVAKLAIGLVGTGVGLISIAMLLFTIGGIYQRHLDPVTEIFNISRGFRDIVRVEPYSIYLVLFAALLGWALTWREKLRMPINSPALFECERLTFKVVLFAGFPLLLGWMLFILASEKSGFVFPFDPNPFSIGGYIPFSDAGGHWMCPVQQAVTGHWVSWCDRRPLAASLRSVVSFAAGYDHDAGQLVQVGLLASALYIAAIATSYLAGAWSGIAFLAFGVIAVRSFLTSTLTEPLGFALGAFAFAAFAVSLARKSIILNTVGVFLLTFALMVRMGAMFAIPAVLVWTLWRFRESWHRLAVSTGMAILAVVLVFGSSQAVMKLYGSGNEPGANFAYVLAGLSLGGTWAVAADTYKEELKGLGTEKEEEAAKVLYSKAIENIIKRPSVFLHRLWDGEVRFAKEVWQKTIGGYFEITGPSQGWGNSSLPIYVVLGLLLSGFFALSIYRVPSADEYVFLGITILSIAASAPFIIFDDGWRALMSTSPFAAGLCAISLGSPDRTVIRQELDQRSFLQLANYTLTGSAVALWLSVLVGPSVFYSLQARHRQLLMHLPKSEGSTVIVDTGFASNGFLVIPDGEARPLAVPALTESAFERVLRNSRIDDVYHKVLGENVLPRPPFAFFSTTTVDSAYYGRRVFFFFGPPKMLCPETRGLYEVSYHHVPNPLAGGTLIFDQVDRARPLFALNGSLGADGPSSGLTARGPCFRATR